MSPAARSKRISHADIPTAIGKPALRALAGAGIGTLTQLSRRTEVELLALHGVGPRAIGILKGALEANGKSFAPARRAKRPTAPAKRPSKTSKKVTEGPEAVEQFMRDLDHPLKPVVTAVRDAVLRVRKSIGEGIKWNAPSFHHGEHFATFNLRSPEHVLLVIHAGAKPRPDAAFRQQVPDPTSLVEWLAADRCVVRFTSVGDVRAKAAALQRFLDAWIERMA